MSEIDLFRVREDRRRSGRRLATAFVASLLLHALLLVLTGSIDEPRAETVEEELMVPLELEAPPAEPQTIPREAEEDSSPEEAPQQVPPDESLLGFVSEGEIEADPDRPVGPESEFPGLPPGERREEQAPTAREPEESAEDSPEPLEPREATEEEEPPVRKEKPPEPIEHDSSDVADPRTVEPEPLDSGEEPAVRPTLPPRPKRVEELPHLPRRSNRPDTPDEGFDFEVETSGGFFGEPNFDSEDYNWSDYSTKVYFAVYRAWLRELLGRVRRFERDEQQLGLTRLRGEVVIRHVIERDGTVTELQVLRPSDLPTLNEASSAALRRAVIPPLPADFPRDSEGVSWRFRLDVFSALQMERDLRIRQQRGQF